MESLHESLHFHVLYSVLSQMFNQVELKMLPVHILVCLLDIKKHFF